MTSVRDRLFRRYCGTNCGFSTCPDASGTRSSDICSDCTKWVFHSGQSIYQLQSSSAHHFRLFDVIKDYEEVVPIAQLAEDHHWHYGRPLRIAVDEADWRFNNLTQAQVYAIRDT